MQAQTASKQQTDFKGWVLWLQWLLANILGRVFGIASVAAVGLLLDVILPGYSNLSRGGMSEFVLAGLIGATYGAGLGTVQWFVLRHNMHQAKHWILASAMSWALGAVAYLVMYTYMMDMCPPPTCSTPDWFDAWIASIIAGGSVGALLFGTTQWLVLRGQFRKAGWWLLVGMGEALLWLSIGQDQIWAVVWAATYAIIPGVLLVWILRHPIQQRQDFW
jgi:hypothetical protein